MMKSSLPLPERTASYQRHRRQFAWQILVPVLVFALLALGAAGFLAWWPGLADTRHLADVAIIWLAAPLLLVALLVAAVLAGLVYLLARLLGAAPVYTGKAQQIFFRLTGGIQKAADYAALPILKVNEYLAALQSLKRK